MNKITILGTGTSTGIPITGCSCKVCTSSDPKDNRLRTGLFLETKNNKNILIDTSPDLRQQLLKEKITKIDSVIITHAHADHLHGIDDLRPFCFSDLGGKEIPVYSSHATNLEMKERFPYIFSDNKKPSIGGGIPKLNLNEIEIKKDILIDDNLFHFFLLPHGHMETLSISHDKLGVIIDCNDVPEEVINFYKKKNLEILIIDSLRPKPHKTHLHLEKAIEVAIKIGAKKTGLIHFSHHLSHRELLEKTASYSPSIFPLFDGQKLTY